MSLPGPQPGLVIRYNYLWHDDNRQGRDTGSKERPAAIVMVENIAATGEVRVYALAISHSAPGKDTQAIEIPVAVKRAAGLDSARSWVVLSEFNEFAWPGYDLASVPGRNPPSLAYGFLTPGFFSVTRKRWLALAGTGQSKQVLRDD